MFATSDDWTSTPQSKQLIDGLYGAPKSFDLPSAPQEPSRNVSSKKQKRQKDSGKTFVKKLKLKRKKLKHPADELGTSADKVEETAPEITENQSQSSVKVGGKKKAQRKAAETPSKISKNILPDPDIPAALKDDASGDESSLPTGIPSAEIIVSSKKERKRKNGGYLEKAEKRLKGSRFRMLNERLYTTTGQEAMEFFEEEPDAFEEYHQGYREQMAEWPENPNKVISNWLNKKPKNWVVADFGCGEAILATNVPQKVHSFDLVALNDRVTVANIKNVPLPDESVDVVVFCLSLMGTDVIEFLVEARHVLKVGGVLKIAEVGSRFDNIRQFIHKMERLGFQFVKKEHGEKDYFILFEFIKTLQAGAKETLPDIRLKPCVYKKR